MSRTNDQWLKNAGGHENRCGTLSSMMRPMSKDRRQKRDLHALTDDGMVLCNPRDKEAAHRAEMEGIAAVTCRRCLALLYRRDKARNEGRGYPFPCWAGAPVFILHPRAPSNRR